MSLSGYLFQVSGVVQIPEYLRCTDPAVSAGIVEGRLSCEAFQMPGHAALEPHRLDPGIRKVPDHGGLRIVLCGDHQGGSAIHLPVGVPPGALPFPFSVNSLRTTLHPVSWNLREPGSIQSISRCAPTACMDRPKHGDAHPGKRKEFRPHELLTWAETGATRTLVQDRHWRSFDDCDVLEYPLPGRQACSRRH